MNAAPRSCWTCGASLEARRRQARTCSPRCRQRKRRGHREPRSERLARRWALRPSDFWRTPPWLVAAVSLEVELVIDVSSCADDRVCREHVPPDQDGLRTSWRAERPGAAWWNPPYSPGLLPWVEQAAAQHAQGVASVGLVPPALGAGYMELASEAATLIVPIRGRVPFLHPDTGEPGKGNRGDSCLVFFDGRSQGPAEWRYVKCQELERRGRWALSQLADVPNVFPGEAGQVLRTLCSSDSRKSRRHIRKKWVSARKSVVRGLGWGSWGIGQRGSSVRALKRSR